ncbi:MAG: TetR/AcrR family transcriptional regulator [Aquabacterium sp.]|uniref:TetR/AcrR family transcriptional regulator n=1 Tax=Aquabacterium sp. TaxID=1872578 RepID=UPI0025C0CB84|nr:TetR/AcrR family transcriptional regulator [Aquabacterium sp.]MBI5925978.1 TetR/AcrR family transcriptional regulator [Aquabacterium sp.]
MSDRPAKKKRAATVTRRYGGVDAAERRRERQRKLIEAGLEVFGRRGYHLSTVRDICTQAALTERYFYESFKTLGELFDAVYAELRGQVQQKVMAAIMARGLVQPDPLAMGEGSLRAWYAFLHEDPRRARIMLVDAVSVSESGMRGAEAAINEFKGMLRTFVSMLYPDMGKYGIDLDVIVSGLAGATIYIAKNWTQSGFKYSLDDILAHNMLIFRSLDGVYKQKGEQHVATQATPASSTSRKRATPSTRKGRRASDA